MTSCQYLTEPPRHQIFIIKKPHRSQFGVQNYELLLTFMDLNGFKIKFINSI